MKSQKKILAFTGIRSEYDILFPVLNRIHRSEFFDLKLVVSGAHLSDWHGNTIDQIEKDGFNVVDRVDNLLMTNRLTQRAKGVGLLVYSYSQIIERENPDFILILGDREEAIAASIVGNYHNKLVVHIGGGDTVYGNADDPIRFAVSKLAHVHFTLCKKYADNLVNSGEENFRVFNVGNPSLDKINQIKEIEALTLSNITINLRNTDYIFFIKHPLSSEYKESYNQMKVSLEALDEFALKHEIIVLGTYPNSDPGSYEIIKVIDEYSNKQNFIFKKNFEREDFVNLIRNAKALVGNSSMGFLEAPFYELPVVNIGNRQKGRYNAGNVEFVEYNKDKIKIALERACFDIDYRKSLKKLKFAYGDGNSSEKIINILKEIEPEDSNWKIKRKFC